MCKCTYVMLYGMREIENRSYCCFKSNMVSILLSILLSFVLELLLFCFIPITLQVQAVKSNGPPLVELFKRLQPQNELVSINATLGIDNSLFRYDL